MPKSQAAKELAAKQKAEAKAAKERRKNSDNPRDWGTWKQLVETYKMTRTTDPAVLWWSLGGFLVPLIVFVVIGLFVKPWWIYLIVGIFAGAAGAMWLFSRRARRSMYARFKGQPGSAEVALSQLDKKTWSATPVIAVNRHQDVIHRALGPGGLVLVAEGSGNGVRQLLASEKHRHEQVAFGVPVITFVMGEGKDQVPLEQLSTKIRKLPKTLNAAQIAEIKSRLGALDAMRPRLPMPKGPMPTSSKGARSAMRGR